MGQRLNIEIVNDGEVLANAYYHWGAYTRPAAELTRNVIDAYYDAKSIGGVPLAVEILQATGVGLNELERERVNKSLEKYKGIQFKDAVDRNTGLLSVTQEGISETEKWEECRVAIDIGEETVWFSVYCVYSQEDYIFGYSQEEYDILETDDFDFDEIKFSEFHKLIKFLDKHQDDVRCFGGDVICWIE